MAVRVRVLGPIEVTTAEGTVAVVGRQGGLLAMLPLAPVQWCRPIS